MSDKEAPELPKIGFASLFIRLMRTTPGLAKTLATASIFLPPACIDNQTIDQEIAGKCGISETRYQQAEAALNNGQDGSSVDVGQCHLTRTHHGVIEGAVLDKSR